MDIDGAEKPRLDAEARPDSGETRSSKAASGVGVLGDRKEWQRSLCSSWVFRDPGSQEKECQVVRKNLPKGKGKRKMKRAALVMLAKPEIDMSNERVRYLSLIVF